MNDQNSNQEQQGTREGNFAPLLEGTGQPVAMQGTQQYQNNPIAGNFPSQQQPSFHSHMAGNAYANYYNQQPQQAGRGGYMQSSNYNNHSSSMQPQSQRSFNPNAAAFKPRESYNPLLNDKSQSSWAAAPSTDYPSNLVSTLHSSQRPYQPQQPMQKGFTMSGPASGSQPPMGGIQYYSGQGAYSSAVMNGQGQMGDCQHQQSGMEAGTNQQPYNISPELVGKIQISANSLAIIEIQIGLEQMISESHEFETWAGAIRTKLINSDFSEEDLALTAALIVEMAILASGCQYNFSRLCHYLDQTIGDFVLHYLLPQLQHLSTFFTREERQNYALFLAELYEKLSASHKGNSSNGTRQQLATMLNQQLEQILELDMDDQLLKTVIRILKLAGRFIEGDLGPGEVDRMFGTLNSLCSVEDGKLTESTKGQVLNLNQLRHNAWGITSIESQHSSAAAPATSSSSILIVGSDGKTLTDEECAFLDEQIGKADKARAVSPSNGSWNEQIEDEVAEEYEKFLQDTAVRAAEKALERVSFDDDEQEGAGGGKKA